MSRLTSDNPRQQEFLAAIRPLVAAKLAELQQTIALRETKGFQTASEVVMTHLGRNIMDERKPVDFTQFMDAVQHLGLYWLVLNNPPPEMGSNA